MLTKTIALPRFWRLLTGMLFLVCIGATPRLVPPDAALKGAWRLMTHNGNPAPDDRVRIFSDGYTMVSQYQLASKDFIRAGGGPYSYVNGTLAFTIDYDSADSTLVGSQMTWKASLSGNRLTLSGKDKGGRLREVWERVDEGQAPLAGDFRIVSRMGDDGAMYDIKPSPRKTIKILSGTRFQWAAMNTETKQFFGTGGGTYAFVNGVYTEKIEFFSRDASRVGMNLSFSGAIEGDDWTHSGKSSLGKDIREVWRRE